MRISSRAPARANLGRAFRFTFQMFTAGFTQYVSPTQVYLLAFVFRFLPPSILLARSFSAFWVFAACLLIGVLARRVSERAIVGVIVASTAFLTPWFFDIRGLVFEPHFFPFAAVVFLLTAHYAQTKQDWGWRVVAALSATLALVTYCYTVGRVLGGLLALGLILFATTWKRLIGVLATWLFYGLTLIPIFVFNRQHPTALVKRLYKSRISDREFPWPDILSEFVRRYLEDQGLYTFADDGRALIHATTCKALVVQYSSRRSFSHWPVSWENSPVAGASPGGALSCMGTGSLHHPGRDRKRARSINCI